MSPRDEVSNHLSGVALIRLVAVVDGEHYPPVTSDALRDLREQGHEVLRAVMVGGREKLPAGGELELAGVEVVSGGNPAELLARCLDELGPDEVRDLSDEPVLDYRRRHLLAAVALGRGVAYRGPDFVFSPPPRPRIASVPSLAVIGTGKRTGKTAIAGFAARTLAAFGAAPVVVAMGRGGPPSPEVLRGDRLELSPTDLLALADAGKHAASDYVEDALLARVPTVGCRRCGGGLAGGVAVSNVAQGVEMANRLGGDFCLLEGSGSALPPVHADATLLVVPASAPEEYIAGYFGPYRLLLSDLVVVTMCEEPFSPSASVASLVSRIQATWSAVDGRRTGREGVEVVRTVFRPYPTRSVEGAKVCVATTAPEAAGESIRRHLEVEQRCEVVALSHSLSDRGRLAADLDEMTKGAEILLCEIKAAGIDVATRHALEAGLDVVYMDNLPVAVDGCDPSEAISRVAQLATLRFGEADPEG